MKRNRILAVYSLCTLIVLSIISLQALPAASIMSIYAKQSGDVKLGESSLNLTIYGDPESARQVFDIFQYFTTQNLQWRGTFPAPPGSVGPDISLDLSYVEFEKLNPDKYGLTANDLDIQLSAENMLNVHVVAGLVNAEIRFLTKNELPALNLTAVLEENVEISFFLTILPLPNLQQALYSFKGDRFVISVLVIKPLEVTILRPNEGDLVSDTVPIQAGVKGATGIRVDKVLWRIEGDRWGWDWQQMTYNEMNGLWEARWDSWNAPNGKCRLIVRAEAIEEKPPGSGEFRHAVEDAINVEVSNPSVGAYFIKPDGWKEQIFGLNIKCDHGTQHWSMGTPFSFWPWIGMSLTAPEYWWDGQIRFKCWRINDESGNTIFESGGPTLMIDEDIFGKLFDGGGRARQLECIYEQPQPPPQ